MKKLVSLLLVLSILAALLAVGIGATDTAPTIVSAVAINDTQFKITTSEPVTVKNSSCFALFVEKSGVIPNLTERDGRFGGSISPVNAATTEFVWTINANGHATNSINAALAAGHKVYFGLNGSAATGKVDPARAVDAQGNGFVPNRSVNHATHGIYGVEVKPFAPNTIVGVKALNDYRLEIEFTKPLSAFAGAILFGVLNPEGTGIYNSDSTTNLDDHAVMSYEISNGKLVCWLNTDKAGMPEDGKNITKFIAAAKEKYPNNAAGIVLLEANVAAIKNTGYLEQVTDTDSMPLRGTTSMSGGRDACAAAIGAAYESAVLESATRLNDYSLKITFNKEVTVVSSAGGFGIVAVNENGKVLFDADHIDMRYGGTVDKTVGTEFVWTIDAAAKRSVTDILYDWQAKGYTVKFCSNSGSSQSPAGYNSRVQDANGNPLLAPVANQHSQTAVLYYALCDITNSTVTTAQIETAVAIDDFRFEITFDKPVKINSKGCIALMAFDEQGNMLFAQSDNQGIAGGTVTEATGTDVNDTWIWTIDNGKGTATDVIRLWELQGYTVKLSANGDSNNSRGSFVNNRITDGTYSCVIANDYNERTKQNCHTVEVSELDCSEDITIEQVVYSGTSQLLVTFSEPVQIDAPGFIGLRIVDANDNYVTPIDGTPGSQHNMIWSYVKGSNRTQIVLTFHSRHMLAMLNRTGLYEPYAQEGYRTVFMIGEKTANVRNGYIDDVVGVDGTGTLKATYAHLVYQELNLQEVGKDTREPLTVVSAVAKNDTDIVITFSRPVEIEFSPFICLRVVDQNNTQVFGENETRLQYYGTWKFAEGSKDTIIWTSNNWNVKGLMSLSGPWAKFNKDGNVTRLCIEELDDRQGQTIDTLGNGFVDNVVDEKGMMLTANSIAGDINTYDGLYVDVVEDYEEPFFYLKSAVQTEDKQLTLTFSRPVEFDGNPYMGIRFVNEANVLQYEDGQPLQYQGEWKYGNEEKTVLIWTATYGGSVTAILNRTGRFANYPDYKLMFCIEEIPADKTVGDTEDGTIHNIYTEGNIRLYANLVGAGANRDGVYVPIDIDYTPKASTSTKPEADDTDDGADEPLVLPAVGGPASQNVWMAVHSDFKSKLPYIALGLAGAVFVGVLVCLGAVLAKKEDEQ